MMKNLLLLISLLLVITLKAQENIRMNQLGFFPNGEKLAAIINSNATSFEIIRNESVVFEGQLTSSNYWDQSQEEVRIADFSELNERGTYQLRLPDDQISYSFRISDESIRDLAIGSIKAYYFNRASTSLESTYAGEFQRQAGHMDNQVVVLPSAATESRPAGTIISTPKGWYDAGDYNKYIVNSGISTYTLLAAFEDFPEFYENLELNIPESDNSIPDILDEALWNIEWMATMQDEDGGVYNKTTHANFQGAVMPHQATATRYVVAKGTAATLDFAGVLAMASRIYKDYLPTQSNEWLQQAIKAWEWAKVNPNVAYNNPSSEGGYPAVYTGGYGDTNFSDEFFWAASELAITTGESSYFSELDLSRNFGNPGWPNVETLGLLSLINHRKEIAAQVDTTSLKNKLISLASGFLNTQKSSPYQTPNNSFYWGSNSVPGNQGMLLLKAFLLNNDREYFDAAQSALDYLVGRNATGYSFVTGFGDYTPMNIHHRQSEADNISDPVPGFLAGGPNPYNTDDCGNSAYPTSNPAQCYVDDWCSYSTNEITINWNAPLVYLSGGLDYLYHRNYWTEGEEVVLGLDQDKFTVYPNPANKIFRIKGISSSFEGKVINMAGQTVLEFHTDYINIENLEPGMYVVKIIDGQTTFIEKLRIL
ncbi:MAG: cellulase [Rickettsiales bacterium]|nr:cellulase [Rickettsiales bacterium]